MNEILTNQIFLDTSIFIKENFFLGKKLNAFLKHSKSQDIELVITEITIKEVISNIDRFAHEANVALKNSLKEFDTKLKIFKNIDSLSPLFEIKNTFNYDNEVKKLKEKFTSLVDEYFTIIQIDSNQTTKIINDYFNSLPPFKDGKKKNEFPDAFVLNSLESYCKTKKIKMYVVSGDEDILSYKSDFLLPIREYENLLSQISYTFSDKNMLPKVNQIITENKEEIIERINEEFLNNFPTVGYQEYSGFQYEVDDVEVVSTYIDYHYVIYFFNNIASTELRVSIKYIVSVTTEDSSMGVYDKEDNKWYNIETITNNYEIDSALIVMIDVEIDLPGKDILSKKWDFKEISNGIPKNL